MYSSIIFTKDTLVLIQEDFKEQLLYHETIGLIIAYDNPFQIRFNGGEWEEHYGIIISEDQNFEVETGDGIDVILTIIPDTKKSQKLMSTVLYDTSIYSFDPNNFKEITEELKTYSKGKSEGINIILEKLINQITGDFSENDPMSEKVESALHYIENNMSHEITTSKIAKIALSTPGHLNFLFRQQTGISMARFVEWTSLASVIISTANGTELKTSVKEAGFMSFSDFSHTFTKIFGITPRQLLASGDYEKALTAFHD
jgi:AraC-like DNA-binding protein